jgi:hypothetical protein
MIRHRLAVLASMAACCHAQLHLITGSPTPKYTQRYGVAMVRVNDDRTLSESEILSDRMGTEWISVSYDANAAVVIPASVETALVIGFQTASVVKQCTIPVVRNVSLIEQVLVELPGSGLSYVQWLSGGNPPFSKLLAMTVNPSVPCDRTFSEVPFHELRHIVPHGHSGVADLGARDNEVGTVDSSGRVTARLGGFEVDFQFEIPKAFLVGSVRGGRFPPMAGIQCSNSQFSVIRLIDDRGERLLLQLKRDQQWRTVTIPSDTFEFTRAFPGYVAVVEAGKRGGLLRESAGRAGWRSKESKYGPDTVQRLADFTFLFPGRLHLYDVERDKVSTIETNQADSEILLVHQGVVYYRVATELFRGDVTADGIVNRRSLANADIIRDAHWAFFKP